MNALLRDGWKIKRETQFYKILSNENFPDFVFGFEGDEEIKERILNRITRKKRRSSEGFIKMNLATTEKEKIVEICERNDIEFCAVFGSFARGEATEESDIDLLVRFSKPIGLFGFSGVEQELEEALGRKVDLATDKMIGKYIRESVTRDLQVIYDKTRQPAETSAYS